MRAALLAATALLIATPAYAVQIAAWSQTSGSNTVIATDDGTTTNIGISNALVNVSQLFGNAPVAGAEFNLSAHSIDAVTAIGAALLQHYAGTFCISAGAGCTSTHYLSGTFSDAAFGAGGGPGLVVNVNNPPDTLSLASDVIPASDLIAPNTFSLGFSNISAPPGLHVDGSTLAAFTASFAGTASANAAAVPEPASLALLGLGILGIGLVRRGRSQSK